MEGDCPEIDTECLCLHIVQHTERERRDQAKCNRSECAFRGRSSPVQARSGTAKVESMTPIPIQMRIVSISGGVMARIMVKRAEGTTTTFERSRTVLSRPSLR